MTVGVVEVGVVSQPGADAERYRCACLHCTQVLAGRGDGYQCGLDWELSIVIAYTTTRSTGIVHTSAKARLTSVAIRIRDLDRRQI